MSYKIINNKGKECLTNEQIFQRIADTFGFKTNGVNFKTTFFVDSNGESHLVFTDGVPKINGVLNNLEKIYECDSNYSKYSSSKFLKKFFNCYSKEMEIFKVSLLTVISFIESFIASNSNIKLVYELMNKWLYRTYSMNVS